ncbi:hypothetical protein PSEUDO9AG_40033 [Pseudomonas sp. 9Ag]|nr:hypothetical protein PSEUDO9AG_40033 [Pseudomonas sp. 9Ag]
MIATGAVQIFIFLFADNFAAIEPSLFYVVPVKISYRAQSKLSKEQP